MGMDIREGGWQALKGERVDLLVLSHVVEHMPDPVGEVARAVAELGPRHVYIEVPDIRSFCLGALQNAHLYYFSDATLSHYFAAIGLEPVARHDGGVHLGILFSRRDQPVPPAPLDDEFARVVALVRRYEWRETIKDRLDRLGVLGAARRLAALLRH